MEAITVPLLKIVVSFAFCFVSQTVNKNEKSPAFTLADTTWFWETAPGDITKVLDTSRNKHTLIQDHFNNVLRLAQPKHTTAPAAVFAGI